MKKLIVWVLVISLMGMTGCTGAAQKKQREANGMAYEAELTQEKKDFLAKMSMDEERIQNGKLYDWQAEVLRQYDFAMEYLKKKYPSHSFSFNSCNPKGRDDSFSTFWFVSDGGDISYDLYLYVDKDGAYSCEDNYYGELLKDSYNDALLSLLQERIPECIGVASTFSAVQGDEFGEQLTGGEVLERKEKISNTTYIYAVQTETSPANILAGEIEDLIKIKKIYGSYYIEILNANPDAVYSGNSLSAYVREAGSSLVVLEHKFNQFD